MAASPVHIVSFSFGTINAEPAAKPAMGSIARRAGGRGTRASRAAWPSTPPRSRPSISSGPPIFLFKPERFPRLLDTLFHMVHPL